MKTLFALTLQVSVANLLKKTLRFTYFWKFLNWVQSRMPTTGCPCRHGMVGTESWYGNWHKIQPFSGFECYLNGIKYKQSSQDERTVICEYFTFNSVSVRRGHLKMTLIKNFSKSVLTMVALCNCATKTKNHFIYAQVLFHLNNFLLSKANFASDHEMLSLYFIKKDEKYWKQGWLRRLLDIRDIDFLSHVPTFYLN